MGLHLIPETVIEEREHWTLAVNRNQDLLGKTMIVLRRPCAEVLALETTEWTALRDDLQRLVPALTTLFSPDQFNFAFLMNLDAQVHMHVIPRYATARRWNGQLFEDAHWGSSFGHEQKILGSPELAVLRTAVRGALKHAP